MRWWANFPLLWVFVLYVTSGLRVLQRGSHSGAAFLKTVFFLLSPPCCGTDLFLLWALSLFSVVRLCSLWQICCSSPPLPSAIHFPTRASNSLAFSLIGFRSLRCQLAWNECWQSRERFGSAPGTSACSVWEELHKHSEMTWLPVKTRLQDLPLPHGKLQ